VLDLIDGWIDGWHPDLLALVEAADKDNSALLSIGVVWPGQRWPLGPVTLLGDRSTPPRRPAATAPTPRCMTLIFCVAT
jgi:hypothetical protein